MRSAIVKYVFGFLISSGMIVPSIFVKAQTYRQPFPLLHDTVSETTNLFSSIVNMSVTCFCWWNNLDANSLGTNLRVRLFYYTFLNSSYNSSEWTYQMIKTAIWYSPRPAWIPLLFLRKHFLNPFFLILCHALILHSLGMPSKGY